MIVCIITLTLLAYLNIHDFFPSSGAEDLPVAVINGLGPIAALPATWGQLKSMYRGVRTLWRAVERISEQCRSLRVHFRKHGR